MLLGKFYLSDHAVDQYKDRCRSKRKPGIRSSINHDLRTMNITDIMYGKYSVHVWTKGYKEFIFVKERGRLVLRTFIHHCASNHKYKKEKCKKQMKKETLAAK